jgi:hypothetical protein
MGAEKVRTLARDSTTPTQLVTNCTKIAASGVEAAHRYMNSATTHLANGEGKLITPIGIFQPPYNYYHAC